MPPHVTVRPSEAQRNSFVQTERNYPLGNKISARLGPLRGKQNRSHVRRTLADVRTTLGDSAHRLEEHVDLFERVVEGE